MSSFIVKNIIRPPQILGAASRNSRFVNRSNYFLMALLLTMAHGVSSVDAASLRSVRPSAFYGCWRHESYASRDRVAKERGADAAGKLGPAILTLCFHEKGALTGYYLEPTGEGGDFAGSWRFAPERSALVLHHDSPLVFRDKPCSLQSLTPHVLRLASCPDEGEFRLACRDPKYPGECPKTREK
jgi:hypothetical protein